MTDPDRHNLASTLASAVRRLFSRAVAWLERVDAGAHRRIKGLRLVTAFAIASMLGVMGDITRGLPDSPTLVTLAGGFALWANVSEGRRPQLQLAGRERLLTASLSYVGKWPTAEMPVPERLEHF